MATAENLSAVIPADWVAGPQQGQWTYEDYAAIPEDGHRYEGSLPIRVKVVEHSGSGSK